MLDNHAYNLLTQLMVEHKSLWRIKNSYKNDADDCQSCRSFWEKLEKDKEGHVEELKELVKQHLA